MIEHELKEQILGITRGELDLKTATFSYPRLDRDASGLSFVRLARISKFWKSPDWTAEGTLDRNMLELITGLHGHAKPWMFVVNGAPGRLECWYGLPSPSQTARAWLSATFPDVRFNESTPFDASILIPKGHGVVLTGIPGRQVEQIEKLCRGRTGGSWLFGVVANPIPQTDTIANCNELLESLWSASVGDQTRARKYYSDLLEAQLKRHEHGRAVGMWSIQAVLLASDDELLGRARATLHSAYSGNEPVPQPIRTSDCTGEARREPPRQILTSNELALLTRPPAAEFPGYEVTDYVRFGVEPGTPATTGRPTVPVGAIQDSGHETGNHLTLPLRDLSKHVLIAGVTGSGKTNTCFGLLDQVYDGGRGVPFLVVESAKSEYRSLLNEPRFRGLKVFTVGDETTSPLRINPFEVPPGILVQTHIDYLKSLFSAAFVLYPPMPYVLEQGLREIYIDRGWDLARNVNRRGKGMPRLFPTLSDLVAKVRTVVNGMGYDERITMDVQAGLVARLDQLRSGGGKGPMLDTRSSIPTNVLFDSPCILELKQLVDDDEKAFMIGLILIRLYEHYEGGPGMTNPGLDGLRHVTLIEEAHRLLRNVSTEQGGEVAANPKGRAIEVFANILSEIRAFGEGFLIAEQVPVKLVPDALKNTNLKIIHRLVAEDDRKAVGGTMNLSEMQTRALMTLECGEAVAYTEGMRKPVLLRVPLAKAKASGSKISSAEIRDNVEVRNFWKANSALRRTFAGCQDCPASVVGALCAVHTAERVSDSTHAAFQQLFNSLWMPGGLVIETFEDFRDQCRTHPAAMRDPRMTYCLFVEMVEAELERRGAAWGWNHRDVEKVTALACELAALLEARPPTSDVSEEFAERREEYVKSLENLHRSMHRPFAGCEACLHRCYFRYDMEYPSGDPLAAQFQEAVDDDDTNDDTVAEICRSAALNVFPNSDPDSTNGAALCFAIQRFSLMEMTRERQLAAARLIAELLKNEDNESEPES